MHVMNIKLIMVDNINDTIRIIGRRSRPVDEPALNHETIYRCDIFLTNIDVLLTVHLSITLVRDQLDAQFFYFIIRSLQSSTCFEQRRVHHQEVKLY